MLLFGLCCTEIAGSCFIKKYAEKEETKHLVLALAAYASMIYLLIQVFKRNSNMLHVNTLWQASVVVLGALVSYFIFGDRLTHPMQYLGILLAILSIWFINWK
jgi:multidrug transporter EmrE-like cation transporter